MYVMEIPISAMFSYIFPWDFGSKNPGDQEWMKLCWPIAAPSRLIPWNGMPSRCTTRGRSWCIKGNTKKPRHNGSVGTFREVSVMWNAGDGLVLAGWSFFRNKMVKHGYVIIYIYARWWWCTMFHWDVHCTSLHVTLSSCWAGVMPGERDWLASCGSILLANHS